MKKIFYTLLLFLASCNSWLEPKPQDAITADQYFKDLKSVEAALMNAYARLLVSGASDNSYAFVRTSFMDFHAKNYNISPASQPFLRDAFNMIIPTSAPFVGLLWGTNFAAINRTNEVIEACSKLKNSEALQAEASFLRAMAYFDLVRIYGDVPLTLEANTSYNPDKIFQARTTKNQVYEQIIKDLLFAESKLPSQHNTTAASKGRATQMAAKSLLAKVYLYVANYIEAEKKAQEVIASNRFILVPINLLFKNINTAESIFELQGSLTSENVGNFLLPRNQNGLAMGLVNPNLLRLYEPADQRLANYYLKEGTNTYAGKYLRNNPSGTDNVIVLRYAEVVLIHAEAAARNAQSINENALKSLNLVRSRAGASQKKATDFKTLNEFLDEIQRERQRELACEYGETWFDMIRTDKAFTWVPVRDRNYYYYPISATEISKNPNLVQNTGY